MAVQPTYPGVYIEEIESSVHTITGVATSITAFVGYAERGPVNDPIRVQSFAEFERRFGGLWPKSTMSYAVYQFFLNGGSDALVVRVVSPKPDAAPPPPPPGDGPAPPPPAAREVAAPATAKIDTLPLEAANEGVWGNALRARIDHHVGDATDDSLFNLQVRNKDTGDLEILRNLSITKGGSRDVRQVLEVESKLVRTAETLKDDAKRPRETKAPEPPAEGKPAVGPWDEDAAQSHVEVFTGGLDGDLQPLDLLGNQAAKTGIYALERADLFNLLCLPPIALEGDDATLDAAGVLQPAAEYCHDRRAVLIVDPPLGWNEASDVTASGALDLVSVGSNGENAAVYFPRVRVPDPKQENRLQTFPPCGAVAGVIARTDAERGVWKAPAGQEAQLNGVAALTVKLTDGENGQLNPLGVNCLRNFAVAGNVVWGARTRDGADQLASEWKYLPVRRLALFLEESLYRGTQWVVFEPNDEPLWSQIRLNVGAFMHSLFRQGAFQGTSARDAYLVKCDKETTTQDDRNRGIVNVVVGFAPLKPAEFVFIKITQLAGQIET